jgi:hypothetical protein
VFAGCAQLPAVHSRELDEGETVRFSLITLVYLAIGVVVALTHGYNSVSGLSEVLSLIVAIILWPAVLFGVDLHLPAINS